MRTRLYVRGMSCTSTSCPVSDLSQDYQESPSGLHFLAIDRYIYIRRPRHCRDITHHKRDSFRMRLVLDLLGKVASINEAAATIIIFCIIIEESNSHLYVPYKYLMYCICILSKGRPSWYREAPSCLLLHGIRCRSSRLLVPTGHNTVSNLNRVYYQHDNGQSNKSENDD